ncbi:hypothetical protein LOAG_03519 [Loa loa]|uniref:Uncharacterized protein n=1 Tax=Loa loa TaxID=7209 RepID=A0A1S0U4H2_LOALO|nr:hypothetical protein LOAG_03519 [Loa loa]EFO24962.2 hypothetical protein LOAG_03519 [Loa loa]
MYNNFQYLVLLVLIAIRYNHHEFIHHALYHTSFPNLVTGTSPVIAECQQQHQFKSCSSNCASTLHAFRLIVPRQQATAVKDVACQCDDGDSNDNNDNNGSNCGCSSNDGFFPSLSLPVKIGVLYKRQLVTFHPTLSCMKLLNDLESENAPLFAGAICESSLSSLAQSNGQKTLEYLDCRNHAPVTSGATAHITPLPVTVTTTETITEQHESKSAFTATVNDIPTRKMTLASSYDVTVVRVRRLTLSRSASDSKLCIGTGPQPELGLADIQPCDARCKAVDELSRVTADIAAENPDIIRFQQVLNSWLYRITIERQLKIVRTGREMKCLPPILAPLDLRVESV